MTYKISIVYNDGKKEVAKTNFADTYGMMRSLEKCEIKSFKIELA